MKEFQLDLFKKPETMEVLLEKAVDNCLEMEQYKNSEKLFASFLLSVKEELDLSLPPEKRMPFGSPKFIEMVVKLLEKKRSWLQ